MSTPITAPYTYLSITASTTAAKKELVAAVTGHRHRIMGMAAAALGAQIMTLQSSTGLTLIGPINVAAGHPIVLPPCAIGYAETAASRSITNQSENATQTCIHLVYQTYKAT